MKKFIAAIVLFGALAGTASADTIVPSSACSNDPGVLKVKFQNFSQAPVEYTWERFSNHIGVETGSGTTNWIGGPLQTDTTELSVNRDNADDYLRIKWNGGEAVVGAGGECQPEVVVAQEEAPAAAVEPVETPLAWVGHRGYPVPENPSTPFEHKLKLIWILEQFLALLKAE